MSSTGVTSPVKAAIQGTKGNTSQIVQIVKLPAALQNSNKAVRLEGQVTSQNNSNNTARIQTPQGDIDVQIKGNKQPVVGQKVEVEIPAGRPPVKATIRTDNTSQNGNRAAQNNSNAQNSGQPSAQATPNNPQNLSTRVTSQAPQNAGGSINTPARTDGAAPTPQQAQNTAQPNNQAPNQTNQQTSAQARTAQSLPPALQESIAARVNNTGAPARNITPDALVRLLSVPPAQAQTIARDFVQTLPQPVSNIVTQAAFKANITAQNVINNVAQQLVQPNASTSNTLTQTLQSVVTQNVQTIAQNIPANNISLTAQLPTQAPTQTSFLQPTVLNTAQALNQGQLLPTNIANNLIASATSGTTITTPTNAPAVQQNIALGSATLTPVPITFDPSNPNNNASRPLGQVDINIVKITPPNAIIKVPLATGVATPTPIPAATQFTPPIIGANTATTLNATVTGFTAQGLPLITIQGLGSRLPQSFVLQQSASNIQLGSQLQIIPKNGVPISTQISPVTMRTFNNPLLQGFQFPALDELYNSMLQVSTQVAASLSRSLPTPGNSAQVGAAAMMFIAAVKAGDIQNWLGDRKIDLLQQSGRSNLLSRLVQDSARGANAPDAATTSSEWRAVPMPMFWENEIHRITLYTRQEGQGDNQQNKDGNEQTRFIFDLNLTRMGDVQIDGLIKGKRLDLVVRTQNAFSQPMQATMRQAYTSALNQTDLNGDLTFQGSTQNWVNVLEKNEQLGVSI